MQISRRDILSGVAAVPAMAIGTSLVGAGVAYGAAGAKAANRLLIGTTIEPGMFKNLVRSLDSLQSNAGYAYPSILDANGYPAAAPQYNISGRIGLPSKIKPSDKMVLKFKGTGTIQLMRGVPGFRVLLGSGYVSGGTDFNMTVAGTNARVVFTFSASVPESVIFVFPAGAKFAGMNNAVLCRLVDEDAIDDAKTPEEMFDDDYVNVYRSLNLGVVRPMGWAGPNFSSASQSRYVPPWRTGFGISTQRWAPGAWAGSASGTNAYICAAQRDAGKSYVDGEMIQLQFVDANTTSQVTIDSGGRGAVPLLYGSGGQTGQPLAVGAIKANSLATLTYDGLLNAFMWQSGGQTPCIPFELQVAFANRINAHYWCTFPAYFDDASITAVTALVRDLLSPSLDAYFEYGNEVWNFSFPVTHWAAARGAALGFPADNNRRMHGWYAARYCQVMELVKKAWSPRSASQLRRVMAFQAFGAAGATLSYRFQGADLSGSLYPNYARYGFADHNVAPHRPIDLCDVLSYATYYSGAQCTNFDGNYISRGPANIAGLLAAADDYASAVPAKMAAALDFLDKDIRAGTLANGKPGGETLRALKLGANGTGIYPVWDRIAQQFGKSVECYEGGFESWYPSTQTCTALGISTDYGGPKGRVAALLQAYKMSDSFAALVREQWQDFMSMPASRTAAWLLIPGVNQWALSAGDTYAPKFKSWDAALAFNHGG